MLAEDSFVNQKLVVTLLEREGHAVTVVGNGRAALAAVASESFDLALMDVQMPDMDGLEATAAIRVREHQTGGHLPIVAMTAHALRGDRERCLEAGMDEYISKPIHVRQLLETIERAVGGPSAEAWTEAVAPAETETVDWKEVLKVAHGDRKLLGTIVAAALEELPRLLAAIREAVAAANHTALRLSAHTLKGSVQYFGASRAYRARLAAGTPGTGRQFGGRPGGGQPPGERTGPAYRNVVQAERKWRHGESAGDFRTRP